MIFFYEFPFISKVNKTRLKQLPTITAYKISLVLNFSDAHAFPHKRASKFPYFHVSYSFFFLKSNT